MNQFQPPKWDALIGMLVLFGVFWIWYNIGVWDVGGPWVGIGCIGWPFMAIGFLYIIFRRK